VLKIGDLAPNFEYIDNNETKQELHSLQGKKLVFFFPKAFTSGCTKQSCSLQDSYQDLKQEGIQEVFGISLDSKETLTKFANRYNLEYIFVSDKDKKISKEYGVFRNKLFFKFADRDSFIIDENNIIISILQNGLSGKKSELGLHNHGIEVINSLNILADLDLE